MVKMLQKSSHVGGAVAQLVRGHRIVAGVQEFKEKTFSCGNKLELE